MWGTKFSGVTDFFKDVGKLVSSTSVLGIDMGTVSLKCVELAEQNGRIILQNYGILQSKGYLERANEALQTSSLKLVENEVAKTLNVLLNEVKPKARTVIASIPLFAAFVIPIEMPLLSPEETSKSISFQARRYIPIPISEVSFEWSKIEEYDNPQGGRYQRILIIAIPSELIHKYKKIFNSVGLKLSSIEVESLAFERVLLKPTDPTTLMIDIGGESTGIVVAQGGAVRYTSQSDYGGASLTQALAHGLGVTASRAEELKRRRGLLGFGGEYELSTSLLPFLGVIIQECERVKSLYERTYSRKVERFTLVGGSANLPGIEKYFEDQLGLELNSPRPFARIAYPPALEPAMKILSSELALSVGLALRFYL
ncbi:type IV pilus assembly protein PilM [Candidatus Jorgensenbacteria bacterium]|nr:type IV pilus assembly protein PilM [Candidatus Jorgensenbacteria bacterium]